MPLALDFTSTLVIGVTLPVATTLLARSPFSTLASFDGSILVPPRVAANTPPAINRTMTTTTLPQMISLRRFFLFFPLPFTTPPRSCPNGDTARWRLGAIPPPSIPITRPELRLFRQNRLFLPDYDFLLRCELRPRERPPVPVNPPAACQLDRSPSKRIAHTRLEFSAQDLSHEITRARKALSFRSPKS